MSNSVCVEVDKDVYLNHTGSYAQFYDGIRLVTILGEYHNVHSQVPPGALTLSQVDYVYNNIKDPATIAKTLIILELPDKLPWSSSRSINLKAFAERAAGGSDTFASSAAGGISTLNSDDRMKIFAADPSLWDLYIDLVYGDADKFHTMNAAQFLTIRNNIGAFFNFMLTSSTSDKFPQVFRDFINEKKNIFDNMILGIYRDIGINIKKKIPDDYRVIIIQWEQQGNLGETPKRFDALRLARPNMVIIQQAILDIGILYQIYNTTGRFDNFVVVVGNAHLRALGHYFLRYGEVARREESGFANLLREKSSDISTNTINLRGTLLYQNIDACLNLIKTLETGE